jgi:Rhs element Vgr protein
MEVEEYRVSGKVPGRILELRVKEGDMVKAGDTLAIIEAPEVEAKMTQAQSAVDAASAMEQMAKAQAMRSGLSRIVGKATALGFAGVKPLDMVALDGVGKRFDGKTLVTAVIQRFSRDGWETTLGLGLEDVPFHTRFTDIDSPGADGVTPPTHGLQSAIVEALEGDPQGEERIRVKLMGSDTAAFWARVAIPYAGDGRGLVFMPEVGDEVIVGFMGGNPSEAVVLGSLHGSAAPPPCDKSDDNDIKTIVTREGVKIEFDDKKKHVVIETPGGNSITVSDDEKSVLVKDQNGNKVTLSSDGIVLDSAKDVAVKAKGDVNIEGMNVNLKANAQLAAKGSASAEISSSGNTVVKGSIVQIN